MSAFGIWGACHKFCQCEKCKKRGNSCSPCQDCSGEKYDPNEAIQPGDCSSGGYRLDCPEFGDKNANRSLYCNSLNDLKKAYFDGNISDVDVSVFLQRYFNYSYEEARKASFSWRYK